MTRLLAVALAAAVLGAGAPADAGAASPTGLPACALGRLPAALRTIVPEAIGRAQRRFGALAARALDTTDGQAGGLSANPRGLLRAFAPAPP
jgi:hypothetical protein